MSWFQSLETHLEPTDAGELASGVTIERRRLLAGSAAALGVLATGARAQEPGADDPPAPPIQLASGGYERVRELLEESAALARDVLQSADRNEDAYLLRLAALLSELRARGFADPFAGPARGPGGRDLETVWVLSLIHI